MKTHPILLLALLAGCKAGHVDGVASPTEPLPLDSAVPTDSDAPPDTADSGTPAAWTEGSMAEAGWESGRRVGAAISVGTFADDVDYRDAFLAEFSSWTPENACKWWGLQPDSAETWNFKDADTVAAAAAEAGMAMKGHALVWHSSVPPWVGDSPAPADLQAWLSAHIAETGSHFAGTVSEWDVVNEAIDDGTGQGIYGLRESLFYTALSEDYIADAFHAARAADPDARLMYNDYNLIYNGTKTDRAVGLLSWLIAAGVPIDGVGLQSHVTAGHVPDQDTVAAVLQRFADLGIAVHISELDVQIRDLAGADSERLFAQAQVVYRLANACAAQPACDLLTFWGFTDRYSWIDSHYGEDDPLPFDEDLLPKPAREAAKAGLRGEPMPGCADERVGNPGFEEGADGWGVWVGSLQLDAEAAHSGKQGARVSGRTDTWAGAVRDVRGELGEAVPYTVSGWVKLDGAATDTAMISIEVTDDDGTRYENLATATVSDTDWTQLSGALTLSVAGELKSLQLYIEGPAAGVELLVDDISVTPVCDDPLPVVSLR